MSTMRAYTREFRESAVGLVLSEGLSIRKAADDLGMPYLELHSNHGHPHRPYPTLSVASNRIGAFDARPKSAQPLSNMYAYDGLHRLVDARRGAWTGGLATPSVSQLKGSQEWALDPLGNWSSVGTDLDGAGGIDPDETEVRDHRDPSLKPPTNRVNELYARELAPDTGGGTVDLAYDYAGNLLRQQLQSGGALRYTHDAWNRLVKVEFEDAEEDLHPRAEYEYNPLNWRTVERTDTNTTDSTHALDEMRAHLYDPSWRLLESRIDSDFDPEETSPDFEEHTQLVWGLRYIDDIVSTRRDFNPAEEGGAEVRMFHATDAQFSSVAVLLDNGSLLERVAYSAYGVARHQWPADASGDGAVNSADLSIVLSSYGSITGTTYRSEADFNRDGDVDAADLAAVLSYAAALPEEPSARPASPTAPATAATASRPRPRCTSRATGGTRRRSGGGSSGIRSGMSMG